MNLIAKAKNFLLTNTSQNQTIAKNTVWLFLGQIISRLMRAAIVIYAARSLGVESWGAFSYALGVATFLTVFSDIGINALITKEATRNPASKESYVATAFFTKAMLIIVILIAVFFLFPKLTDIPESALIMPILIFVFVFDTLRDLGSAIARSLEKMQIEAGISIFTNATIVALGLIFLYTYRTSTSLAAAYAIGSGAGCAFIFYKLRSHFGNIFKNFKAEFIKPILTTAWPFGLLGLMGVLMLNTDIIMLGWLKGASEVGYYSAAQKLIQVLYVLPTFLAVSVFPVMARGAKSDPQATRRLLEKSIALVFAVAVPIAIIGIAFARQIIIISFGDLYAPAITTFQILIATIVIVFPSSLIGNAIFAYDEERRFIGLVAVSAIGNGVLDFLLIPKFGIEGAAAATLITQSVHGALIWTRLRRINGLSIKNILRSYE